MRCEVAGRRIIPVAVQRQREVGGAVGGQPAIGWQQRLNVAVDRFQVRGRAESKGVDCVQRAYLPIPAIKWVLRLAISVESKARSMMPNSR